MNIKYNINKQNMVKYTSEVLESKIVHLTYISCLYIQVICVHGVPPVPKVSCRCVYTLYSALPAAVVYIYILYNECMDI